VDLSGSDLLISFQLVIYYKPMDRDLTDHREKEGELTVRPGFRLAGGDERLGSGHQ
jgi:hypothetical protein